MVASGSLEACVDFSSCAVATDRPSGRQNGPWKRMGDDNHGPGNAQLTPHRSGWNTSQMVEGHGHRASICAVTCAGGFVFTGSSDCTVRVWTLCMRNLVATLRGHSATVLSILVSGSTLYSGDATGVIRCWNIRNWAAGCPLVGHKGAVWCLAANSTGTRLFSGSSDFKIIMWGASTAGQPMKLLHVLRTCTSPVYSLVIGDNCLYSASGDSKIRVWFLAPDSQPFRLSHHLEARIRSRDSSTSKTGSELGRSPLGNLAAASRGEGLRIRHSSSCADLPCKTKLKYEFLPPSLEDALIPFVLINIGDKKVSPQSSLQFPTSPTSPTSMGEMDEDFLSCRFSFRTKPSTAEPPSPLPPFPLIHCQPVFPPLNYSRQPQSNSKPIQSPPSPPSPSSPPSATFSFPPPPTPLSSSLTLPANTGTTSPRSPPVLPERAPLAHPQLHHFVCPSAVILPHIPFLSLSHSSKDSAPSYLPAGQQLVSGCDEQSRRSHSSSYKQNPHKAGALSSSLRSALPLKQSPPPPSPTQSCGPVLLPTFSFPSKAPPSPSRPPPAAAVKETAVNLGKDDEDMVAPQIWDCPVRVATFEGHENEVLSLCWDRGILFSGDRDGVVKVWAGWDPATRFCVKADRIKSSVSTIRSGLKFVRALACSGDSVFVGGNGMEMWRWSRSNKEFVADLGVRSTRSVFSLSVAYPTMGTFHGVCRESATKSRRKGQAACDAAFSVPARGTGDNGHIDGGEGVCGREVVSKRPVLVSAGEDSIVRALWRGGYEVVSPRGARMSSVQSSPQLNSVRSS